MPGKAGLSVGSSLALDALLFAALLVVYSYFIQPPGSNALSRYDAVLSLANQHTTAIDAYQANAQDKGLFAGHYYSDKPPGVVLVSLPVYVGLRAVLGAADSWPLDEQYVVYLLNFFVAALPTALLAVLLRHVLRRLGVGPGASLLAAVAYGTGTLALPFATLYFGHQTSAFFGFAAFAALFFGRERARPVLWAFLGGLSAGLAVLTEYPLAIVAALLGLYVLARFPGRRGIAAYVLGGLPAAGALLLYNYVSFGDPLRLSYENVYLQQFAQMHQGFFGLTNSDGTVLLALLFSGKGLLTLSPVLALVPAGLWALWKAGPWRPEARLLAGILVLFPLYNSAYFLPFGGWTPGPRFLTPMLPFAAVAVGVAFGSWTWAWRLGVPLAAYSTMNMFLATATVPLLEADPPWPLVQSWLPALANGEMALNLGTQRFGWLGAASLLPLLLTLALALSIASLARPRFRAPGWLRLASFLPLLLALTLAWPVPLPGTTLAASALSDGQGSVTVASVRELPRGADGARRVAVVVQSNGGAVGNLALQSWVEDAAGRRSDYDLIWPFSVLPGSAARFVITPSAVDEGSQPLWFTVDVVRGNLIQRLAEVRMPFSTAAHRSGFEEVPIGERPSL